MKIDKLKNPFIRVIWEDIPTNFTIIGESGIKKYSDIYSYNQSGVYNFLIGESILTSKNIQKKFDELLNK